MTQSPPDQNDRAQRPRAISDAQARLEAEMLRQLPPWHRGTAPMLRHMLLSWFGCGLAPRAPGTVGSLGALPLGAALQWSFGGFGLAICAVLLFFGGWAVASHDMRENGTTGEDPQWIVVDEVVGQWLVLAAVPLSPLWYLTAFALFRLFDVWKPWPVSWADRKVGGGLGVMLDDVLAAAYAVIVVLVLTHVIHR